MHALPSVVVVTRQPVLQKLLMRWGTRDQAQFVFKRNRVVDVQKQAEIDSLDSESVYSIIETAETAAAAEFSDIESEAKNQQQVVERLRRELELDRPVQIIDREFLPSFNFANAAVVVVVGQDGLVANTAKYVGELPIVAINPDPGRIDGVLLPFQVSDARMIVQRILKGRMKTRAITLAKATLQDGQSLLAFNDLFVGASSHISARYTLRTADRYEHQSSSGLLISTGAGSTGWMSSVVNMAKGLASFLSPQLEPDWKIPLAWDARELVWAVREPFVSKTSQARLVAGRIQEGDELIVESLMSSGGVIFSDGVEQDFLPFTSGTIARIGVAGHSAKLVVG